MTDTTSAPRRRDDYTDARVFEMTFSTLDPLDMRDHEHHVVAADASAAAAYLRRKSTVDRVLSVRELGRVSIDPEVLR